MDDRAQIAAMCLQGLLSSAAAFCETPEELPNEELVPLAVALADELLAELSKTPPSARTKETPSPPTDPGESEAGEPKDTGAFGGQGRPVEDNPRPHGLMLPSAGGGYDQQGFGSDAGNVAKPQDRSGERTASAPLPSVVFDCEARFEHDPVCPGPAVFDPVSKGRFCGLHAQIPEGHRREMHRLHGSRNRPLAPVERLAG